MSGTLYLCATPIGNLDDITLRVLNLLKTCDLIAAEDTRHTLKLLNHFEINTPMTSYHDHNRISKGPYLIEKLKGGLNIALVTDAGMPGISDPGEDLARLCYEEGVPVTVAPGASAAVTALVLSGMATRSFVFEGFLPTDKKEKAKALARLQREERTAIFYEAPHRLTDTLAELLKAAGNRNAACIRELTKRFEEVRKAPIEELLSFYKENPPKGEFVVIIEGADGEVLRQEEIEGFEKMPLEEHMKLYTDKGMTEKEAMKQVAKDRGLSKRDIYAQLKQ